MSTITLTDGVTTADLPGSLDWSDRYSWAAVAQTVTRGLTNKPIVQSAALLAGRPITLEGGTDRAWVPRSTADALQGWADTPGKALTLSIYGQTFEVLFRHQDAPAFAARPVADRANPPADWPHYITLKLMTRIA